MVSSWNGIFAKSSIGEGDGVQSESKKVSLLLITVQCHGATPESPYLEMWGNVGLKTNRGLMLVTENCNIALEYLIMNTTCRAAFCFKQKKSRSSN
jgi:hypothetical protein